MIESAQQSSIKALLIGTEDERAEEVETVPEESPVAGSRTKAEGKICAISARTRWNDEMALQMK